MHAPILVPVDLSSSTHELLTFAGDMATRRRRSLVLLHVVTGADARAEASGETAAHHPTLPMTDKAREQLQRLVAEVADQHPELDVLRDARTVLISGVPAHRILEVAEREGAGMIIMGSHGRRGVSRVVNGSVAEAVARKSPVPVTIVKDGNGGDGPSA